MSNASTNSLSVKYYDGHSPMALPATLIWTGANVKLIGTTLAQNYPSNRLRVSPPVGQADRFVALPDGGQLQCPPHPVLDRLPQEGKTEGVVAWLEQRWPVALIALVVTIAGLGLSYFYGLPMAADKIATRVPMEYERRLGERTVQWLDNAAWFKASTLPPEQRQTISAGFSVLTRDLPLAPFYRLEFRRAPGIGPNAFALPGGIIVITDELIELSESPEEVLAVLAHEIGHVERRHALRQVLQASATAVLAATFTSDASSLTLAVSGVPVLLAKAKYSREFETEADDFGLALLKRHDLSPEYFATMMERLEALHPNKKDRGEMSFLSTHPVTAERIARARAAARQ